MEDLTIIMIALNKLPKGWQEYHKNGTKEYTILTG